MLFELLSALQGSEPASALRASRWVYPLVNAGHIAGLALLIGSIVPLDLRLLGLWRSMPVAPLARVLLPVTVTGLALAVSTGALLFSVHAVKYAGTTLFQAKLLLILAALANAALLRFAPSWKAQWQGAPPPVAPRLVAAGLLSIGLWLSVLLCGRFLAFV